jgi:hypothetical protein
MKDLYAAMAKAFPEIEGASKDKNNPHFKSKYADLSAVVEAIKPALTKHGLFFVQQTHEQEGGVCVETVVCHSSGESMPLGKLFVPASKQDAQGYGSALTYARRYSLMTAFGVCPEDDDGNAASKPAPKDEVALIDETQRSELQALIEATASDIVAFCKFYKVGSLPELPVSKFAHAQKSLKNKLTPKDEVA